MAQLWRYPGQLVISGQCDWLLWWQSGCDHCQCRTRTLEWSWYGKNFRSNLWAFKVLQHHHAETTDGVISIGGLPKKWWRKWCRNPFQFIKKSHFLALKNTVNCLFNAQHLIKARAYCFKITQNVSFNFSHFGTFHQFCPI